MIFYTLFYLLPTQIAWLFAIMAILVFYTAGQQVWWARRYLQ
ncbi:MAG: hypothetical protein R2867_25710 [Caldilineaceae bacterium]